ncbi:unnamed protein product [Lymnaea stagnalis]|uniref:Uncharacterized protein n=1 Tax=Lymnaea stagnalis TaxID=6523 RepID=A0AAV2H3T3_LYMST
MISRGNNKIPDRRTLLTRSRVSGRKTGPSHLASHRGRDPVTDLNENEKRGEHVELLEFEWPDLPPLNSMENAVCRSAVSRGINYSPAVAKGRNVINSRYRTDLRARLQDHHPRDYLQVKDSPVTTSSTTLHLAPNRPANELTSRRDRPAQVQLNADSESIRRAYVRSAPSGGNRQGLGYGLHPRRPTKSVSLFLPTRNDQKINHLNRLNQEGDDVNTQDLALNLSMHDKTGCIVSSHTSHGDRLSLTTQPPSDGSNRPDTTHKLSEETPHPATCVSEPGVIMETSKAWPKQLQTMSYEDLCAILSSKVKRSDIPQPMVSPYLALDANQRIWDWLHSDEQLDEFDHFMSMCG